MRLSTFQNLLKNLKLSNLLKRDGSKVFILLLLYSIVAIALVIKLESYKTNDDFLLLNSLNQVTAEKIEQVHSLEEALEQSFVDRQILIDQLAALKSTEGLRTVTTTTVLEASPTITETVIRSEPAPAHIYKISDLVVAELQVQASADTITYTYPTYDLLLESTISTTDTEVAVTVMGSSSFDPEHTVLLHTDTHALAIKEHHILSPSLLLGAGVGWPAPAPTAMLSFSGIHATKSIDVGLITAGANNRYLFLGIQPIAFNIGSVLPIIDNTYVGLGGGYTTQGQPLGFISLQAKL